MMTNSPTVAELEKNIAELESTTRMLVRRDLELKRAYRSLEEADQRKSEFVSIAAHQLRTPLSALLWTNQMLFDGDLGNLSKEQFVSVSQTLVTVKKLTRIVNDMLRADHLEYDKVSVKLQLINLAHLVSDVVADLVPLAEERHITVHTVLPHAPVTVECDPSQLREAFSNIIGNAIKYSYAESDVTVSLKDSASSVEFAVEDNGIGIPQSQQSDMFKKFMRADNARRVDANGSGLGLFIVDKIVKLHHGSITIDSTEGKGTEILVELPKKYDK